MQLRSDCRAGLSDAVGQSYLTYLGAAQADRYGNINTTLYGEDYTRPKARVSGSGGGHDLTVGANRVAVIMPHGVDRICDKLDYRTSPGFCEGFRSRWDT